MAGIRRLDLRRDPAPDLAIDTFACHSTLDRLALYAKLGVPEVWRLDGEILTFHVLDADGRFSLSALSRAFPPATPNELVAFIRRARVEGDSNPIIRDFQAWIRQRRSTQP